MLNYIILNYFGRQHYIAAINEGGINFQDINIKKNDISIYAENRKKTIINLTIKEQLIKFGYWDIKPKQFYPNCYLTGLPKLSDNNNNDDISCKYKLRGIIASSRVLSYKPFNLMLFIGYDINKFIELNLTGLDIHKKRFNHEVIGITVLKMKIKDEKINSYEVIDNNFEYW